MSADAIAIRQAVAATRRLCPEADLGNMASFCITQDAPIGVVKVILFDVITEAVAARPPHVAFRRASLPRVLAADRRALS